MTATVPLKLIPLKLDKILRSKSYASIVLDSSSKRFAIYTDLNSGKSMLTYLTEIEKNRPSTHDLLAMSYRGLDIKIKQIIITDVEDTVYFARLYLEQQKGDILHIVEIDARPSDCITLALIHKAPIYCTTQVLEKAVAVVD